jgi:hypothetical protein
LPRYFAIGAAMTETGQLLAARCELTVEAADATLLDLAD